MNLFRRKDAAASSEARFFVPLKHARLIMILPFILAALAIYGLNAVRDYSDDRRVGQLMLARVEAAASRQNVLESGTLQLAVVADAKDPEVVRAVTGLRENIEPLQSLAETYMADVRAQGLPGPIADRLDGALTAYHTTLNTQVDLLEEGDFDEAFRYDHLRIEAAARILGHAIDDANVSYERLAKRANGISDIGTVAVVLFAALILALLQRQRTKWAGHMAHQALHDPLTNLPNRLLFKDRVEHALARSERNGLKNAVLLFDLDNFKSVNDTLGHEIGDHLLIGVAERVQTCLRPADTVARLGGDEYAILLEDVESAKVAETVARRVLTSLDQPFELKGHRVLVNGSIGIDVCTHLDPIEDILANADVAMYAAKARGKGTCELYEPNMRHAIVTRVDLESDLRNALDANEFILQYQPIIEVATGTVAGVEALVRWMHPTRGLVPPLDFIPLAEQTGLILPLGKWVLETAAIQAKKWQLEHPMSPPLRVGVNLSARQLQDDGLIGVISEVLEATGLEPSSLILEVTESVLMRDTQSTMEVLRDIKRLDVQIAVDDFGTGYSSLSYLKHFPVDVIKIDKSFVDGIENGSEDAKLVRAIIQLGESLGLKTVAEGIETRAQLEELRRLGCKEGQGFYVARPLDQKMMDLVLDKTRFEDDQEFIDATPEPVG